MLSDATKIQQVVRNLLSNAIKFTPEGGTITIALHYDTQGAIVTVLDQGPGVPEAELEIIFDKFVQSSLTKTGAGGTGLGLAICHEIMASHHGRIWAENHPAGGAKFTFVLPMARTHQRGDSMAKAGQLPSRHGPSDTCRCGTPEMSFLEGWVTVFRPPHSSMPSCVSRLATRR